MVGRTCSDHGIGGAIFPSVSLAGVMVFVLGYQHRSGGSHSDGRGPRYLGVMIGHLKSLPRNPSLPRVDAFRAGRPLRSTRIRHLDHAERTDKCVERILTVTRCVSTLPFEGRRVVRVPTGRPISSGLSFPQKHKQVHARLSIRRTFSFVHLTV
jgi:hypothetical protein